MVVCKFFLQGNCRFGANCRYEHPAGQGGTGGGGGGGFGNQNRFGALANTGNNRFGGANDSSKPYTLNPADIRADLTRGQGRPQWVLSTYGAGRSTPASLFEGNEFSPEEIRVRFYEMAGKGQEGQADLEAIQLWTKAEQDLDNAASHIDDVTKFMEEWEKKHPNRYDFLKTDGTKPREELAKVAETPSTSSSGFGTTGAFGQSTNNANPFSKPAAATFGQASGPSAFGGSTFGKPAQPSAFGQPAFGQSAFGASPSGAFGQSSSQSSPAFGQPSSTGAFGQPASTGAFGKPAFGASGFGQSGFGQPAQPSISTGFGQTAQPGSQSPFGQSTAQPAFGASAFGQPAKPNPFAAPVASSGFGTSASTFGQSAQNASAFGQPSQPGVAFGQPSQSTSAFGQPSQTGSGFGQSAFGQPAQPSAFGQSAFGQPAQAASSSPFGQPANAPSGFGVNNSSTSAFGQPPQQNTSPFGQPTEAKIAEVSMDADAPATATTQILAPPNPFGIPQSSTQTAQATSTTPTTVRALAQARPNNDTSQISLGLTSNASKPLHYTQTLPAVPPQTNGSKRLISYRGQRVEYLNGGEGTTEVPCYNRPDGRGPEKIWFPEASATQEVAALNREDKMADLQEEVGRYTEEVKGGYKYLFEVGRFERGRMPLVPPLREWCVYDF